MAEWIPMIIVLVVAGAAVPFFYMFWPKMKGEK